MAEPSSAAPTTAERAEALARFCDALLPGDDLFPAATAVGSQGVLALRLRRHRGEQAVEALISELLARDGLTAPMAAAARLEEEAPAMFDLARVILTYAYYEAPAVIDAIRSLGHRYNAAPQPDGYAMRPFDAAIDTPGVPRGHFVPTDAVVRADLSALDFLGDAGR